MKLAHPTPESYPRVSPRITPEMVAWAVVVLLAILVRSTELGKAPMSSREATLAMLAWQAATGDGVAAAQYSSVLLAATASTFATTGAGDSFSTAFLVGYMHTGDVEWSARFGAATVIYIIERSGGVLASRMPVRGEVDRRLGDV